MPFLSSLFALLLIGALFTWASTYHFIESVWERQAIKYTERSLSDLNRAKHELLVMEAYSKSCTPPKDAQHEDQSDSSEITKKEKRNKRRKEKISELQRDKRSPKKASRFLHLYPLFDPSIGLDDPTTKSALFLLNRLSYVLFSSQDFYIQMNSPRGYHGIDLDSFYKSMIETARKLSETETNPQIKGKLGIKKPKELANLLMPSLNEQYLLYKALRGGGAATVGTMGSYRSLLEFISLEKRPTLMNLYLAPRTLLFALFGNMDIVDEICEYRQDVYLKYNKKRDAKEELEQQFQSKFESHIPHEVQASLIDFQISLTRPSTDGDFLDENLLELP